MREARGNVRLAAGAGFFSREFRTALSSLTDNLWRPRAAAPVLHGSAIFRFHPGPESVSLRALAIIGLKCGRFGMVFLHRRAGAPIGQF